MIGYLKGKVLHIDGNVVLLETGGVGYEISCSSEALTLLQNANQGEVYTYMNVYDGGVSLYGFVSIEEKSMFLKLISVSGVGPKMAIAVLSSMPLKELAYIIASQDAKTLSTCKGVGKKTAERIILELRESISNLDLPEKANNKVEVEISTPLENDAVIALMSLGFSRQVSTLAVKSAINKGADTIETIITIALQNVK